MDRFEKLRDALLGSASPSNVRWRDLTVVLSRAGARIRQGKGSTLSVALNDQHAYLTFSHPNLKADQGAIETVRSLLKKAGVKPG